jgi:hypothetical protein
MRIMTLTRLGQITVAWSALFVVVHAYWAAGGEAGMNGDPADTIAAQSYIAFITVLGLLGGAVAHGFVRKRRRTLVLLARAGGVALLLGVVVGTGRWLQDGGLNGDGAAGLAITLYFLLGGVLFSALGWRRESPGHAIPAPAAC